MRTLLLLATLLAAPPLAGPARAETVWYLGHDPDGRSVLLELTVDGADGAVEGRLLGAPPPAGPVAPSAS